MVRLSGSLAAVCVVTACGTAVASGGWHVSEFGPALRDGTIAALGTGLDGQGPVLVGGRSEATRGAVLWIGSGNSAFRRSVITGEVGSGVEGLTQGHGRRGAVFATSFGGLMRSLDRGVSWTVLPGSSREGGEIAADRAGRSVYVMRNSSDTARVPVLRSRDGGRTWGEAGQVAHRGLRARS